MKKRKFYVHFLTVIVLILSIALVGCSNNETTSKDSDGKVTIQFSMWDTLDDNASFIKDFEEKNPNINIELVNIPEDYSQKINSMIIGGTAPDVILSWEADINRFAESGAIDSLEEYIEKTDAFKMEDFIPAVNKLNKNNGSIYGLPWSYASEFLYYNKDMFDKAGVEYPTADWTWADFEEAAKKLTIREGSNTVQWGADAISFPGIWYSSIGAAGDDVVDAEGNLDLSNGLRKTLEFQNKLTNEDKVIPQPSVGGEVSDLFAAGKAAMTRNGSWYIASYKENDFNWDIAPLPKEERSYSSLHTGFFTINSNSEHKEEAWKFIEYMMGDTGQSLISKQFNNPSTRLSVAEKGEYQVAGEKGPENWDVFDKTAQFADFGYVLVNPTVTNELVQSFNAVLLGNKDIDEVINKDVPSAQKKLDKEK
ncbi:ABC transporter substrate-binding protein [Metabacillus sediminilitoris]|uniref:Sugar ABC transporter substrate-binding protein n=1 Tax=Metabacillus sediminilitoris TaxID=2567941 RepID=A0A4S4BR78_9BACI|nr:sugar ABC transporter substrate-binding protein [Metabacillus sediminilitoris]QGQ46479.1 extracellular solute-binding protein [Metabacillus sediminilitoris]THF77466.1 sugar ABC transporter substrate-binding protein [Metabacillus sediminilitoris]